MSKCRMKNCENELFKNGLCAGHYKLKKQNKCIVEGCNGEFGRRGMCIKHYARWQKYGDPAIVKQDQLHGLTLKERLYARAESRGDCLEWTGNKDCNGYGRMKIEGQPMLVHRVAWELHNGPIPEGICVLHRCDNPPCIKLSHLFIGTINDNVQDCIQKGRDRKRGLKGEDHNLAKLTEAQVIKIRNSDERGVDLARRYNVTQTTISDIRKGRIWQHLPSDPGEAFINRTYRLTETDVIAIRNSNKSTTVLAKYYGVTARALCDARYGRSWKHLPGAQVAVDRSPLAKKFTIEDILAIRASNESSKVLAAKHRVHKSSITNIRSRRTWNHID